MFDALLFELKAFQELMFYVNSVTTEICGIGRIAEDQFGISRVTDIRILPQTAGAADANVSAMDMENFFNNLPEGTQRSEWCFNFHTHPKFATNPSGTDLTNYSNLAPMFNSFVPMIINQLGAYTGWVYYTSPIKTTVGISNIWIYEWREDYPKFGKVLSKELQMSFINMMFNMNNLKLNSTEVARLQGIVDENVKQRVYQQPAYNYHNHYGNWQRRESGLIVVNNEKADNPELVEDYLKQVDDADQAFFAQEAGMETGDKSLGEDRYLVNPHNWPLADIIEEMEDLGYEYKYRERHPLFRGHSFEGEDWQTKEKITMNLQDAKKFLLSVLFRTEEKSA